jgi:DNA (cytosine-5)-methyltransferase 1
LIKFIKLSINYNILKKYTFIDLFAGCGGLSEGFLASNKFEGLAHVEWELPMVKTLRNRLESKWNHSKDLALKSVVHFDIQESGSLINGNWSDELVKEYGPTNHNLLIKKGLKGLVKDREVDVIIGGPPCQAYSIAGRAQDKNSMKDDYRNYLFESFVRVVDEFKPRLFIFENVPGMLSAKPGGVLVTDRVYQAFSDIGYQISEPQNLKNNVYSADDFQVPQKRRRLIIVGVKKSENLSLDKIYEKINNQKKSEKLTVRDVIENLDKFHPLGGSIKKDGKNISHQNKNGSSSNVHHSPRFHNDRDVKIFKKWIVNDMNNKSYIEKIDFYNQLLNKKSKHAKYRNLDWNKPSPTIVAHLYKDGLMFIHPDEEQARSITVKEAALLQSFPDDFEFIGGSGVCYKMIGNAVPPKMAECLAIGIYDYLKEIS